MKEGDGELAAGLAPIVAAAGLDLYDVEVGQGLVRVTVDREGGVDLDTLAALNATLSRWLDAHDPMPGRYSLEVSSPGLERPLRTPAHFAKAVGEAVTLRVVRAGEAAIRVHGTLLAADDHGVELATEAGTISASYDEVERARTVFAWGSTRPASPSKGRARAGARAGAGREA